MTAHGAYTKAKQATTNIKELVKYAEQHLKQLYKNGTLQEDPELIAGLQQATAVLRDAREKMYEANERTADIAEKYLKARGGTTIIRRLGWSYVGKKTNAER